MSGRTKTQRDVGNACGHRQPRFQMRVQLRSVNGVRRDVDLGEQLLEQHTGPGPHLSLGHTQTDEISRALTPRGLPGGTSQPCSWRHIRSR